MISHDDAIIWRSLERALCKDRADKVYAAMMDSSIMICCCISADKSVQRPWRMRSTTARTDGTLDVKGAATEASPGRSTVMPVCCSIAAGSIPPNISMRPPPPEAPADASIFGSHTCREGRMDG